MARINADRAIHLAHSDPPGSVSSAALFFFVARRQIHGLLANPHHPHRGALHLKSTSNGSGARSGSPPPGERHVLHLACR
jgi:hypothetical protein